MRFCAEVDAVKRWKILKRALRLFKKGRRYIVTKKNGAHAGRFQKTPPNGFPQGGEGAEDYSSATTLRVKR